jgi:2-polyprenyl-6-methoxyphenol hydroxylase-like FAD-dependent oxidoreductase
LPLRFGTSIQAVEQKASRVSVRFTDGSSESYDLVIGADGIRSTVRRLAFGGGGPRFRGQMGWRFIAQRTSTTRPEAWTVYLGDRSAFLLVPIGHDAVYCYADELTRTRAPEEPAEAVRRLRECFGRFASPVPELLDQLEEVSLPHQAPIEEVSRQAWGLGRVGLIGDAAHAMSPNMACGAALALEDAIVLGDIIARRGPAADVVSELARRRSARVRWVRRQTNQRDRLRHLPSSVRNFLLRRFAERIYRSQYQPLLAPL